MENNKKTLILSILGVLVLVIAVVGVSFAMYSFSATGTTENVIQTGSVSVQYENESVITLTNQYPMTDALGIAQEGTDSVLTFDVTANIAGTINIKYDLALDSIAYTDSEGNAVTTLTDSNIKFVLTKSADGAAAQYVQGSATEGVTFADVAANTGNGYILKADNSQAGYVIDSDTFTANAKNSYVLKAWIDQDYKLPGQAAINGTCSDASYDNKAACEHAGATWTLTDTNVAGVEQCVGAEGADKATCTAAGGTWSVVHADQTDVVKVTFKVKVVAKQA